MARVSLLAFGVMVVGCTDHNGGAGMIVLENTAPSGTSCMLTGVVGQPTFSQGEIYVGSTVPYIMTPLIESRITAIMGQEPERTILLSGANVSLAATSSTGAAVSLGADATFTSVFAGSIPPGGTVNVSFALVPTSVLAKVSQTSDTEIVATVTVLGTLGGGQVEAEPFSYPVTACDDCIVNDIGSCGSGASGANLGNPCNAFQDGIVDCCEVGSGSGSGSAVELQCPAAG